MKKLLVVLLVLVVLAGAGAFAGWRWLEGGVNTAAHPEDATPVLFVVPKGATARSIGTLLEQQGFVGNHLQWRYFVWKRGGLQAKAGRFELRKNMAMPELATVLEGAPIPEDVPFAVIEGWRLRDTDAALVEKGWIKPGEYVALASDPSQFKAPFPLPQRSLEGYLYPETYRVVPDHFDLKALIQRQLDTFVERFYTPNADKLAASKRTLHDIVVMASMLEREEPSPEQRPLVAGILWKRIDRGFALGVDATSRYELADWNDKPAFLKRLRDPNDPWNTRVNVGLPPGPIGAPAVESLTAALNPVQSDFLYYLHDAQRVLRPSRDAAEHEAMRRKYNVY